MWALNPATGVVIREEEERRHRQERRTHRTENKTDVNVKAEAGLTQLQAKERLEPPEAGRGS